jgi:hypothetical protein
MPGSGLEQRELFIGERMNALGTCRSPLHLPDKRRALLFLSAVSLIGCRARLSGIFSLELICSARARYGITEFSMRCKSRLCWRC